MTTYKEIFGKPVKVLSTDPSNDAATGQIWYNNSPTSNVLKTVVASAAWASSASMATASRLMAGFGTQTAAVSAGGNSNTANLSTTQEYNGTGWTIGGAMPEARFNAGGLGTQTAGMSVGGGDPPGARSVKTFEYNGSAWTAGGDLTEEREGPFSFGTETAGICAGGESLFPGGVTQVNTADEYNGSSWTAVNAMSTTRYLGAACGVETAGVVFGGEQAGGAGYTSNAELYDGTNWTSGGTVPSAQKYGQAVSGVQTDALLINGFVTPNYTATVSEYNGSTFAAGQSTAIPRAQLGASKQQANTSNALAYGGVNPGYSGGPRISATEEYNVSTNVITGAAWAAGGNLNTSRRFLGGTGTQTTGLVFGGFQTSPGTNLDNSEEYNGSAWTEGNNINTARRGIEGFGTQTAGVGVGGFPPPGKLTEHYDGTSWTNATAFGTARMNMFGSAGTQTAGLIFGGSGSVDTESYDGSSWTEVNNLPTQLGNARGNGTQTAALSMGGDTPAPAIIASTFEWDGSNWTVGGSMVTGGSKMGAFGTQTDGYSVGGVFPGSSATVYNLVQNYNGTAWVTDKAISTGRNAMGPANSAGSTGLIAGGDTGPGPSNATEAYTAETSALNVKTITTS